LWSPSGRSTVDTLSPAGTEVLFANPLEPQTGYVLWFRPSRRRRWEPVFQGDTESQCVRQMSTGCNGTRRGGMWLILPAGREP
jgi:hypothetical protein